MLKDVYRTYIAYLNKRDWKTLGQFIDESVVYNGQSLGLSRYRHMLEQDFENIPDLRFNIDVLVEEPSISQPVCASTVHRKEIFSTFR
jgi:predicted ester cyclase